MSTRWYPLYQRGNPQLRVFLPNFWMTLMRPELEQPKNVVQFSCSMQMTTHDIKNYLEKIYKIPVIGVRTRIAMGETQRDPVAGYVTKKDDEKIAYVTLHKGTVFEFPNLFPKSEEQKNIEEQEKSLDEAKKNYKSYLERNKNRPGTPGWYSI